MNWEKFDFLKSIWNPLIRMIFDFYSNFRDEIIHLVLKLISVSWNFINGRCWNVTALWTNHFMFGCENGYLIQPWKVSWTFPDIIPLQSKSSLFFSAPFYPEIELSEDILHWNFFLLFSHNLKLQYFRKN